MTIEEKYIHARLLGLLISKFYDLKEQNIELGTNGIETEALINWSSANAAIKELNTTRRELLSQPRTEEIYNQLEKLYDDVQAKKTDLKTAEVTLKIKSEDFSSQGELEKYIIFKIGQKLFDLSFDIHDFDNEYSTLIGWYSASEKIKEINKQLSNLYVNSKSENNPVIVKQVQNLRLNKYVFEIEKYNHAKSLNNYASLKKIDSCPIKCDPPKPPQQQHTQQRQREKFKTDSETAANSAPTNSSPVSYQNYKKKVR